jgi:transcription elongation factor Elf1
MKTKEYIVMTVECPRCKTKQKIHLAARGASKNEDRIPCLNCDNRFEVTVPDRIVGGPFPA